MNDTETQACPRIYTRCPACHNDTLTINKGHLLCTWHECKDPTLLDRTSELVRAGDRAHKAGGEPEELKALASATCSAAASADKWAELGRTAATKAQLAVDDGEFGSADGHRKNAEQAFGFERQLRQPPNVDLSHTPPKNQKPL